MLRKYYMDKFSLKRAFIMPLVQLPYLLPQKNNNKIENHPFANSGDNLSLATVVFQKTAE